MRKIELVASDTLPDVDVTLRDAANGQVLDLSGAATVVSFDFAPTAGTSAAVTIVCTKPGGGMDGVARITWGAGQLTAGEFEGEFNILYAGGRSQTVYEKIRLSVRPRIGS